MTLNEATTILTPGETKVDENLFGISLILLCIFVGISLLSRRVFALRLMSALLFLATFVSLTAFSGIDESGQSYVEKIASSTSLFLVAVSYLFFLMKFEATSM